MATKIVKKPRKKIASGESRITTIVLRSADDARIARLKRKLNTDSVSEVVREALKRALAA